MLCKWYLIKKNNFKQHKNVIKWNELEEEKYARTAAGKNMKNKYVISYVITTERKDDKSLNAQNLRYKIIFILVNILMNMKMSISAIKVFQNMDM